MNTVNKIQTVIGTYVEDITGQVFNRLTVLELTDKKDSDNRWLWKCQCSCDNKTIVYTSMHHLKGKNTKSCGCLQKEWVIKKNRSNVIDITGEKKGKLTALRRIETTGLCEIKCECGNIFTMSIGEWNRDKYGDGHRAKYACPKCTTKSKGQLILRNLLKENNISFLEEWTDFGKCINPKTNCLLRFDFYLPDYNCCIEYDGEHHFIANGGYFSKEFVEGVKQRDIIKSQYCKDNNIKLIRIPYTDFKKISIDYLKEKGVFSG